MSKFIDRTGEVNIAKNGQKMTVIACRLSNDIDVQFEDGTIVKNKTWKCFKVGSIRHPNINSLTKIKRIGETNMAKNGQKMTIIAYRNSSDIDVKFEDGTVVTNKTYSAFLDGYIKNTNKLTTHLTNNRIGETKIATNGQKMTIINYRNNNNIDVQFEDNTIVTNKTYQNFKLGNIENPNKLSINYQLKKAKGKWINDSKLNISNGLYMTVVDYISSSNATILFETGYKATSIIMQQYVKGVISHPFPYQMNNIIVEKLAYIHKTVGNFYCKCSKCGLRDIWTIDEAKNHKCEVNTND